MVGTLGGLGNLGALLKQAKSFQENMRKMQEELAKRRFEADAGAGLVRATVDGKSELVDIKIDAKAVTDIELLEDLIKSAVGAAARQAQDTMKADMAQMAGGLNLPGLTELLGQGLK